MSPRLVALLCSVASGAAAAHGANPQAYAVVARPAPLGMVNTSLGTFQTSDDGAHWDWVCLEALGPGRSTQPLWFMTGTGAFLIADYGGLSVTRDGACSYEKITSFDATGVSDLDRAGDTLWATTGRYGVTNGIFRSTDDGATWGTPLQTATTEFFASIRVAPSQPQRLYASAWWFDPVYTMALYRSDDGGANWARTDLTPALPEPGAFYVHAVHPTNPDLVLGSLTASRTPNPGVVLRSTNGGATWTRLFETALAVSNAVFSGDGTRAWVASGNTLYESTDEGATFALLPRPSRDVCATPRGALLYACGNELIDGYVVARRDGAGDFAPFMNWSQVTGPRACPAGTAVADKCGAVWPTARAQIDLLMAPNDDGGPGGGAGGGGEGGGGTPPGPCGCTSVAGPGALIMLGQLLRKRAGRC